MGNQFFKWSPFLDPLRHEYLFRYASHQLSKGSDGENPFLTLLENIFKLKTVLFVGYGLSELEVLEYVLQKKGPAPNVEQFEQKHFILQGFFSHQVDLARSLKEYFATFRDGLSKAVEQAIRDFANGFVTHRDNEALRQSIRDGKLSPETYYQHLLRLIYRLLFLLVIEERDLIFPASASRQQRDIFRNYYSVERLRLLSEKSHLADKRFHDHWLGLLATFRLFEAHGPGVKLGVAPLAGDLFNPAAIGILAQCKLGNDVLLGCLRSLGLYQHPDNGQTIRVNYAALNVEEFGSVYEGLLEFQPIFLTTGERVEFDFVQGDQLAHVIEYLGRELPAGKPLALATLREMEGLLE